MSAVDPVRLGARTPRRTLHRLALGGLAFAVAASVLGVAASAASADTTGSSTTAPSSAVTHPEQDTMGSGIRAHEGAAMAASSRASATSRGLSFATAAAPLVLGHDVSNWQPNINWTATAAAGAKFVYIKATEGTNFRNPIFAPQYIGSYLAGIIRGAYTFALPDRSSGATQANFFVDNGGGWSADGMTMPPMLDLEYNPYGPTCYGLTPAQMVAWVRDFSNTVKARTGIYPVIYTSAYYWNMCTGSNATFGATNPLFIAYYPYVRSPLQSPGPMPAGWAYQSIWQYSDSGTFPGDADVWNGTMAQLKAFVGTPVTTPPVTTPPVTTPPVTTPPVTTPPVNTPPVSSASDPIDAYYTQLGGAGYLGDPTGDAYAVAGGKGRDYKNGSIYWSAATGAHLVRGAILARYRALNGPAGILGFPITDQLRTPDNAGAYNTFSGMGRSSIYWTSRTGAHAVGGAIRAKWRDLGGPTGLVGYPLTDELPTSAGAGRYNSFTGADLYWSRTTGAHEVNGAIRNLWNALGNAKSTLGLPTSDEYSVYGGRRSDFQNGNVTWLAATKRAVPTTN
jgi:GH25 family lysozyme M1 (1,4-beta-N-acetylmuramidase)